MIKQVRVPLALTEPTRCNDILSELFSAGAVVRHHKVGQLRYEPGEGPFRQTLIIDLKADASEREAQFISDEVVGRVINRTSGGVVIMHYVYSDAD